MQHPVSGYGDEGSIESIEFLDAGGKGIVVQDQFPNLEDTFCALLPEGYGDNEGSSGSVIVDVDEGRIAVKTDWNVTTTESEYYEV